MPQQIQRLTSGFEPPFVLPSLSMLIPTIWRPWCSLQRLMCFLPSLVLVKHVSSWVLWNRDTSFEYTWSGKRSEESKVVFCCVCFHLPIVIKNIFQYRHLDQRAAATPAATPAAMPASLAASKAVPVNIDFSGPLLWSSLAKEPSKWCQAMSNYRDMKFLINWWQSLYLVVGPSIMYRLEIEHTSIL